MCLARIPRSFARTSALMVLCAAILASCDSESTPVQPDIPDEETALAPELAVAANSWSDRAPIPGGRQEMGIGVVKNSSGQPIVYLLGGFGAGGSRSVIAYNHSTNSWTTKAATQQILSPNGTGVIGSKLYVSGGVRAGTIQSALWKYDPARDQFIRKANMPIASQAGLSGVINNKLYVLAGWTTSGRSRRLFRYDPATNRWSSRPQAPNVHLEGVAGVIREKLYVAGGFDANGDYSDKLDVYDPATNSWKSLAPMPVPQAQAGGAVLQNKLFVIGGSACCNVGGTVYVYDPTTNQWGTRAPLNHPRYGLDAVSFISQAGNPRLLALGGEGDEGEPSQWNEEYTP